MTSLAPARQRAPLSRLLDRLGAGRHRRLILVLLLLLVLAPPTYLAHTGGALATGYNIQRLQAERNGWRVRNQQLELEVAKARSLAWIETEAVNRLGMQKPAQQTVIRVDVPPPAAVRPRTGDAGPTTVGAQHAVPLPEPQSSSLLDRLAALLGELILRP